MKRDQIKIYTAGKTWAAHWFKGMRAHGFNINAQWIDVQHVLADPTDTFAPEVHEDTALLGEIWEKGCKADCLSADMMILAASPVDGDKHSGSLVELGHVTGQGKPCYILGTCASFEPVGHSDRAFKFQRNCYHWPEYDVQNPSELLQGFKDAIFHYQRYYERQWHQNNGIAMPTRLVA